MSSASFRTAASMRSFPPLLTILVVNQRGRPGEGFIAWDVDDLQEGYRRVWAYPWHQLPNPFAFALDGETPDELAKRLRPGAAEEQAFAVLGPDQDRGVRPGRVPPRSARYRRALRLLRACR